MSEFPEIAEQQQALAVYLRDMLNEAEVPVVVDEAEAATKIISEPVAVPTVEAEPEIEQQQTEIESWQQSPFQALLMEIHGLKMAVPVHQLDGILKWPETTLSKMPGKPDWYLGLVTSHEQYTQVIDTAHIVLPANKRSEAEPTYIVLIDDKRWGLACHKVSKVVTLSPEQVKWRHQPGKRPWLAGTMLEQMCSIIHIPELIKLLNNH